MAENFLKKSIKLVATSTKLEELPIFKNFIKCDSADLNMYALGAPEGLERKLEEIYGQNDILMDCSMFAQFYCQCITKPGTKVIFWVLNPSIDAFGFIDNESDIFHYIYPTNETVGMYLRQSNCLSKGQFVVKQSNGEYLGLSSDGVISMSLEGWVKRLKSGCIKWSNEKCDHTYMDSGSGQSYKASPVDLFNSSLKGIIRCYTADGGLDKWTVYSSKSHTEIDATAFV